MTLLEVIVAMVVLSVGIAGLVRAFSSCVMAGKAAESYTVAATLAQQAVSELERQPGLAPGELSGGFEDSPEGYTWEATVGDADANGLMPVQMTVYWLVGTVQRHFQVQTYIKESSEESTDNTSDSTQETEEEE